MAATKREVLTHWGKAGIASLVALLGGLGTGWLWATKFRSYILIGSVAPWVQLASGAFFLWCVLGLLGWKIQTWHGDSPAEQLNVRLLWALNVIGMYALFTSSSALIWG